MTKQEGKEMEAKSLLPSLTGREANRKSFVCNSRAGEELLSFVLQSEIQCLCGLVLVAKCALTHMTLGK